MASCTPVDEDEGIGEEVVYHLVKMNEAAVVEMDLEADSIGQELYPIMEKLAKLGQLAIPAYEWVEIQSEELPEKKQSGSWRAVVPEEGLTEFKNDQYRITHLEFQARNIGEKDQSFSSVIKVSRLGATKENHMETVFDALYQQKLYQEDKIKSIGEKRLISSWTLNGVIRQWQGWEIQKIDDVTFTVSGPGLGIAGDSLKAPDLDMDEKLITGQWTYHRDSGKVVPADSQSAALEKVLSGEF